MSEILLGPPGALQPLPDPDPGVSASRSLTVATHEGVGGGALTADVTLPGWRSWTYAYTALTVEEADMVERYRSGIYGPGPYALIDPTAPNRLQPNQASAGKMSGASDGFAVLSGDALAVVRQAGVIGPSVLSWTITPGGSARSLLMSSTWAPVPSGSRSFPIPPDSTVHLSAQVRTASPPPLWWRVFWWDAGGASLGGVSYEVATVPADTWTPVTADIVPPTGAAWVLPGLYADTSANTAAVSVSLDALVMSYGARLPVWRPGQGVPQVVITAWTTDYPYIGTVNGSLQLTEVG